MKTSIFISIIVLGFLSCSEEKNRELQNQNGDIEIHRYFCDPSAYRYLIVVTDSTPKIYYNPVNLPDDYKDGNYKIVFSYNLLNDSSAVYSNLANDALIELFKVRNITLTAIRKISK